MKLIPSLTEWISEVTKVPISEDTFLEDLHNGVALCILVQSFGQVVKYHATPKNVFLEKENRVFFQAACLQLDIVPLPDVNFSLESLLSTLLKLAKLSASSSGALTKASHVLPLQVKEQVEEGNVGDERGEEKGDDKGKDQIEEEERELEKQEDQESYKKEDKQDTTLQEGVKPKEKSLHIQDMEDYSSTPIPHSPTPSIQYESPSNSNSDLKEAHFSRLHRQQPRERTVERGGESIIVIERPGEAIGSILWAGSDVLIDYLYFQDDIYWANSKVVELGAGCGSVGIWCAMKGATTLLSDDIDQLDLLWSNIAVNAQFIVNKKGSCAARILPWQVKSPWQVVTTSLGAINDVEAGGGEWNNMRILASDVMYNDTLNSFTGCVGKLLTRFPLAEMLVAHSFGDIEFEDAELEEKIIIETFADCGVVVEVVERVSGAEYVVFRGVKAVVTEL